MYSEDIGAMGIYFKIIANDQKNVGKKIMQIMTYWNYEDIFDEINCRRVILPMSYLKDENNIDLLLNNLIKDFESTQVICYGSFLNMVYQTQGTDYLINQSGIELRNLGIRPKRDGILFHRSNLLYLIALKVLNNDVGTLLVRGKGNESGSKKLYESLLLINNKFGFVRSAENFLVSYILREHPYSYEPRLTLDFYQRWLKRYWHIYSNLLEKMTKPKELLINGIKLLENDVGLSMKEYFIVLTKIFGWFLWSPQNSLSGDKKHFDPTNIGGFYICASKFSTGYPLITLLKRASLNLNEMKDYVVKACQEDERKGRKLDQTFKEAIKFFERPLFKIDEENFCIIDFKFLIEGICTGLIWRLWPLLESSGNSLQDLRSQYGYLLENYFRELLVYIFGISNIIFEEGIAKPDAIVRFKNYTFIFEFTVEYYKISSLYNSDLSEFDKDLEEIFFNKKTKNSKKGKKSKGKAINLNGYVQDEFKINPNNNIIPILVTEKQLGDSEFLSLAGFDLSEKISSEELNMLKARPPLILCLDDLELFWSFADPRDKVKTIEDFLECLAKWQKEQEKGKYLYNFGNYINHFFQAKKKELNNDYLEFFSFSKLGEELRILVDQI